MKFQFSFFTQYGQFYLADEKSAGNTDSDNFWNDESFNDKLAIEDGILGISLENDEAIANGELEILNKRQKISGSEKADHIVEASIKVNSGKLQIQDCPNSQTELEIELEAAWYRIRVYSMNLNRAYESEPGDFYRIEIWKEGYSPKIVLKRWSR